MPLPPSDFRSDTVTRPTPAMREAMARAEVGDDVLGEDPTVKRLEATAAALLGKEAGLFVPSGTMANQIGVKVFTQPGDEIIAEEQSHVLTFEAGAIGLISGVQCRPVKGLQGVMDAAEVEEKIREHDIHAPRTALICVENTHNLAGGAVVPLAALDALRAVAERHGVPLFLDGARLFNAAVAEGVPARAFAARADLVWFALSKGLSAPVGSVLCGGRALIERCRRIRKQLGGGMRQAGIIAAAGLVGLESGIERLAEDHARAARLARALAALPGVTVDLAATRTNIVMVSFAEPRAAETARRLAERGVLAIALAPRRLRFVTHREVGDEDVERAIQAARAALAEAGS